VTLTDAGPLVALIDADEADLECARSSWTASASPLVTT